MKIKAVQCKLCGDIIYSRAQHDFHYCSCGAVAIDGGFAYLRICGEPSNYEQIDHEVNATQKELYDDWSKLIDKFGKESGEKDEKTTSTT